MLIRREKEYNNLAEAYEKFRQAGKFQLRFITGEAGTGKTVLANMLFDEVDTADQASIDEVAETATADRTLFVSSFCCIRSEYNIPYQPFKELLKQLLQDVQSDQEIESEQPKTKGEKFKDALKFSAKVICEHAPDLIGNFVPGAAILGAVGQAFFKDGEEVVKKDPTAVEESKILEQYLDAIRAISERYKLVIFIDDLQWIDNLSVNLLYQLIMGLQNNRVMIIGSYRSTDIVSEGVNHPMSKLLTEVKINFGNVFINLDTISKDERKAFMDAMLDTESNIYDAQFRERLFMRTNGNPLFIAELLSLLKESGMIIRNNDGVWMNNADLEWNSYPVKIEGIIQERIGKLEDSLVEILSYASVQGYNFIAQVLSKTMGESELDMLITLSKRLQKQHNLVNEGSCVRSNKGILSYFNFSNYIFQQYLYQELSMSQRLMLHSDIAAILEELYHGNYDEVAADIAKHYELSGENEKCVKFLKITVANMMRVSGYEEAAVLIKKALAFIEDLAQTDETDKEKLYLFVQLCICYRSVKGWGDPEVEKLYIETKKLSEELEVYDHIHIVTFGIWAISLSKLKLDKCLEMARESVELSRRHAGKTVVLSAQVSLANTLYWLGELDETARVLSDFFNELDKEELKNETTALNHLLALMFALLVSWHKGESQKSNENKTAIEKLIISNDDHFYQVVAYRALAWYSYLNGDKEQLKISSDNMMELSEKYNFHFYLAIGKMFHGAYLIDTNPVHAERFIESGYRLLLDLSKSEITAMHSLYSLILADCYLHAEDYGRFEAFVDGAIERSEAMNERCYLDSLLYLKGQYYKNIGEEAKSAECLASAAKIAAHNGAVTMIEYTYNQTIK